MVRRRGKSLINWILVGLLLLGLGGWGVTSFTGGSRQAIGSVGSVDITAGEYARALGAEIDAITAQTGERLTGEEARGFGLPQAVQSRLIASAALEAEAREIGLSVGDARVAAQIMQAPAFSGFGSFDPAVYADVLRRQGMTVADFEQNLRMDEAGQLLQQAIAGGVAAPTGAVEAATGWLTETRDLSWMEITPALLTEAVAPPDEAALQAWWQANPERFTASETRTITYAWVTPEMLEPTVQLDEEALRQVYETNRAEFQQPARRMVDRLVYPSAEAAAEAKARLDAGEVDFDGLVAERGLTRADIDLGEVTEAQLGAAGPAVFAAPDNGVIGPVETPLGPALISINAILDPIDIPFEAARDDLRTEAAADRARRDIVALASEVSDHLAGGATLEQLAEETPMELGTIEWQADAAPEAGSIAAYPSFRTAAAAVTEGDYAEAMELEDGGIFALRLDALTPPAVIPFEEAREQVLADWTAAETKKRLLAIGDELRLEAISAHALPQAQQATGLGRDGVIEGLPGAVVTRAFALDEPGEIALVDEGERVFLVMLDAIHGADETAPETGMVRAAVERTLSRSIAEDVFTYHTQALTQAHGLRLNPQVAAAVDAQL
ncbi:peptidylprolyl isomerase [Paracoccus sp. S-4012]|uniref:peptidylprolyl isomerase n=1 Tax=Paracoccus sp. S-4012 TaxID=2665648 RepID=UPI0012B0FCB8|nr:peptidylprolyl isomerase [Paracoccus sp. S-4012]MRX50338.1 peptidylprolyl isomerase [Paracoccus sp. S-4012]